jgi:uncharacterized protein DUF11
LVVSQDGTVVAFGTSITSSDWSTEDGISVFQKINGSWTEAAFLKTTDFMDAIAISAAGDVVAVADGNAVEIFREPSGGWVDATPSFKLTMPHAEAGHFSTLSLNATELLAVFQPLSCNFSNGCGEAVVFVEPSGGWRNTSSPEAEFQSGVFGTASVSFSDALATLSSDTIAAIDEGGVGTVTQLAPDWSGGQTVNVNPVPSAVSSLCGVSGDAFTGNLLAILGYSGACGASAKFHVELLQQTSSSWASPGLLAKLTPSDLPGANTVGMAASANTVGVAGFDRNGTTCISLYIFQQPVGGWVDANETVKYSGLGFTGDCEFVGGSLGVSDSVIAIQTGDTVEVLDDSPIQPTVDLRATATLTDGTIGAAAGRAFQTTITVSNDDPHTTAPSVTLTSAIPSQLSHVSLSGASSSCRISAGTLNCTFGNLAPGQEEAVALNATAPAAGVAIAEVATVTDGVNVHSLRDTNPVLGYSTYTAPTAQNLTVTAGYTGSPLGTFIRGQLHGSDPNHRPLSYSLDGAVPPGMTVKLTDGGDFGLEADQTVGPGTYSFKYVANNGFVNSLPATVTVVIGNGGDQGCNTDCNNINPVTNVGGKGTIDIIMNVMLLGLFGLQRFRRRG